MLTMHPTTIIPEIAFVTDIKGVCNAGVTFQMTMYPVNIAKMKIPTDVTSFPSAPKPKRTVKITATTKTNNA